MKIDPSFLQAFITLIVSGALGTLVTGAIRSWGSMRKGARASTRAVIADLADDRREAEERTEHWIRVAEYWRQVAGNYQFQLRSNGISPDPKNPIPPVVAARDGATARRRVRELEDTLAGEELDFDRRTDRDV